MKPRVAFAFLFSVGLPSAVLSFSGESLSRPYVGFDSRLTIRPMVRHRMRKDLLAFQIFPNAVGFLYPDQLVAQAREEAAATPVTSKAWDVPRLSDGSLWLAEPGQLVPLRPSGPDRSRSVPSAKGAAVRALGTTSFLEATEAGGIARFYISTRDGGSVALAAIPGALRCYDWTPQGFSAVVGNAIYTLRNGGQELLRLDQQAGYDQAVDVATLPGDRVLVALPRGVLLVGSNYRTTVVGMPARLRGLNGIGYLLDVTTGMVWAVKGWDKLGPSERDMAYARQLLSQSEKECRPGAECVRAAEAARLLRGPARKTPSQRVQ
jgi:hypothetical protein